MEENIRKYINSQRIEFLNSLPTEQFLEGFPGLHQYKRNQIKAILRNRGEFDANSDLLDAMLKIDDFPGKFIAFCVKHDCCLDLAQGIRQELRRIAQDQRRIKSSQSTSQVSNLPNAEAGSSLQNTVAGMSVQNVFVSNNENYEQSMNVTPCQSPESRNHQQKDEPLQKSSSLEDTNSQNNESTIMNRSTELDSTSQNLYDNTAEGACQIVDRNYDENTEGLNTSSDYSSSFMLSDSDLQNCNMSSCHEITNLKLNIQKEEKESETYVQPRQHIPSNLSQISIENNEEVTPVFEVNHLGPVVGQNIPTTSLADLSVKKKLTLENVNNQAVSVAPPAHNVSVAQYSSMYKSSVMVAASSDDWNYVSTPLNCHSLGEPNIPETEEDIQNFDKRRTCYERTHNFKGVQCQEDLQNHKLLPVTVDSNAAYKETNEVSLETSEESSNTELKVFGFTPVNNFTNMETPYKQRKNSEVKNNNETPDTENFNARSRDSFQDSSDESFVQGLTGLKADDRRDLQVKEGNADTDLQLKEGNADTDLQQKEGNADTYLQLKEGNADTDLQKKEGNADTDLQLKEGNADTDLQLKGGNADTDLQLKKGNADTEFQLKEGNADTELQLQEGNANTDLQLKEGNANTDLQLKEGNANTDLQLKEGNANTDLQLKEGNPDEDLQLKEGNANTDLQLKEGNPDEDLQLKEGNADTEFQLKEGNPDADLQLKEGNADTEFQLKEGNTDTDRQLKEGNPDADRQLKEGNAETENQLEEVVVDSELTIRNSTLSSEENLIQANEENNNSKDTNQSELCKQMVFSDVTTQVPDNIQHSGNPSVSRALRYVKSKFTSLYVPHAGSEVDPPSYLPNATK